MQQAIFVQIDTYTESSNGTLLDAYSMDLDACERLIVAQILQPFVDGKVSPLAGIETAWEVLK